MAGRINQTFTCCFLSIGALCEVDRGMSALPAHMARRTHDHLGPTALPLDQWAGSVARMMEFGASR